MKKIGLAGLLAAMALGSPAMAQGTETYLTGPAAFGGKHGGDFMVRVGVIGVLPETLNSRVTNIGGQAVATTTGTIEADLSYFLTDHLALELIAGTTKHELIAKNTALGDVDVGSAWVLPPTLTLQYHFLPRERFSPYVGAGGAALFFYDTKPAGGVVTDLSLKNNFGGVVQAGFDYNIQGNWYANVDLKQIFADARASINGGAIRARTALDPTVFRVGIGLKF